MNDTTGNLDEFLGTPQPKPWRRWAIRGAGLAVVVLLVLLLARCFGGSDAPNYSTREVRRGDLTVTVSATGNLKPINQVDVGSEQSGKITEVYVDVNDRVTKGQKLAELDTRRLIDNVTQNVSQVAAAQAGVAQAEAQQSLARATLARQEDVFRLSGGKVPSKTELDTARANLRQAIAQVRSAQAQVSVNRAQLSSAQTNLDIARIVSPVNGVVLSRAIEPGQTVAASFNAPVLFTIAEDLKQMEVEVAVDEADVGQVKDGQSATFTVDAFPGKRFPARITRVNVGSNAANASSSSSSSSSSAAASGGTVVAYTAVLAVANPDETLRPGMTATADIITKELHNVLTVPNAALRFNPQEAGGKRGGITSQIVPGPRRFGNRATREVSFGAGSRQTVYVVGADGKPKAVSVTIGDSDGTRTAVTGGELKEGAKVITGQLAAGQEAPEADRSDTEQRAERRRQRDQNQQAPVIPPAAPAAGSNASAPSTVSARDSGGAPAPAANSAGSGAGQGQRMRDMTPEQRRAFLEAMTPEQREAFRKQREERRKERASQREAAGSGAGAADGE
jgi:HlyD family secretion protein